jgi:hypothetical protein
MKNRLQWSIPYNGEAFILQLWRIAYNEVSLTMGVAYTLQLWNIAYIEVSLTIGKPTEFAKFVSPVRHDQQNLGRFCQGLTQDWYFAIEN